MTTPVGREVERTFSMRRQIVGRRRNAEPDQAEGEQAADLVEPFAAAHVAGMQRVHGCSGPQGKLRGKSRSHPAFGTARRGFSCRVVPGVRARGEFRSVIPDVGCWFLERETSHEPDLPGRPRPTRARRGRAHRTPVLLPRPCSGRAERAGDAAPRRATGVTWRKPTRSAPSNWKTRPDASASSPAPEHGRSPAPPTSGSAAPIAMRCGTMMSWDAASGVSCMPGPSSRMPNASTMLPVIVGTASSMPRSRCPRPRTSNGPMRCGTCWPSRS